MRDGWIETTLGAVADLSIGRTPPRAESRYWTSDLSHPFCTIADMTGKWVDPAREGVSALAVSEGKARPVSPGTLLMSFKLTLGRVGFAATTIYPNEAIVAIAPRDDASVLKEYLYLFLGNADLSAGSGRAVKGATLNSTSLAAIDIALPPLEEQRRIVDLLESVDTYIAALAAEEAALAAMRSNLLGELLTRGGEGWIETTLGEVALVNPKEGPLSAVDPFVPMDAVKVGERWVTYTEPRGERSGARARAGDILYARITPCLENGKVAQVPSDVLRCGGSTEFIVVRGTSVATNAYLYFWASSDDVRHRATQLMTGSTGRQRLAASDLAALDLMLPPLEEQRRIVDLAESVNSSIAAAASAREAAVGLRAATLGTILSGEHQIPASYDELLETA